jgi:alpha-methylacyl-CoA racemase
VLSIGEAASHPHMAARGTFVDSDGICRPGPAPRFERCRVETGQIAPVIGADTREVLAEAGYGPGQIESLIESGTIAAEGV